MITTTITLELVRHGPLHNQLLSPLTPYIALAGNRPAETVYVPVEHAQMLAQLHRLRKRSPNDAGDDPVRAREAKQTQEFLSLADIREASQVVTRFLESARGLADAISEAVAERLNSSSREAEDGDDDGKGGGPRPDGVIHLRLIVSANELSLLPFELAQGPLALGGCDMLSTLRPPSVVITRESRRAAMYKFKFGYPDSYRVLLVAADPDGRGLPLEACLLALRRAYPVSLVGTVGSAEAPNKTFRDMVKVLPNASLEGMREELAAGAYSHVLILAHGRMPESLDARPAVLFHERNGSREADPVSAERLAAALCTPCKDVGTKTTKPRFVSLMVCDSGNEAGGILFAGGSIAHIVHEAGIPFVVASQFPISFGAAALLTDVLFSRLLRNENPLGAVAEARQRLFMELGDTHDWAALVAYATLQDDSDLEDAVRDSRFDYAAQDLNRAMWVLHKLESAKRGDEQVAPSEEQGGEEARRIEDFRTRLKTLRTRFDAQLRRRLDEAGPDEQDWRTAEVREADGSERSLRRAPYDAGDLANACLREAQLRAKPFLVWEVLTKEAPDPPKDGDGSGRSDERDEEWGTRRTSVREALVDAQYYARAHFALGGRRRTTYNQMTLALELLAEVPSRPEPEAKTAAKATRRRALDGARRWWRVADWRFIDGSALDDRSNRADYYDRLLVHLLMGVQIGDWNEQDEVDLQRRLNEVTTCVMTAYQTRRSREEVDAFETMALRLKNYRYHWWAPDAPGRVKLQQILGEWRPAGLPLDRLGL